MQSRDTVEETREQMQVVSARQPSEQEWEDMLFGWIVCRHVRSNAIVIARDGATVGIGAGQMSRVDAVRIAIEKAQDAQPELLAGSALASDAFFPFADGPELAMGAGVTALIQPGRLGARRGRRRRRGRGGGGDGRHRAPPLPALRLRRRATRRSLVARGSRRTARASPRRYDRGMCRNIRNLYNFEPPATDEEVHASSLQYVRKISGFTKPSQANEAAFERAVEAVAEVSRQLLDRARHERPAEGPRGRGRQGPRPRGPALRGLKRRRPPRRAPPGSPTAARLAEIARPGLRLSRPALLQGAGTAGGQVLAFRADFGHHYEGG